MVITLFGVLKQRPVIIGKIAVVGGKFRQQLMQIFWGGENHQTLFVFRGTPANQRDGGIFNLPDIDIVIEFFYLRIRKLFALDGHL